MSGRIIRDSRAVKVAAGPSPADGVGAEDGGEVEHGHVEYEAI